MLGPLTGSNVGSCSIMVMLSSTGKASGTVIDGQTIPSSRGSVISPVIAAAAATSGLTRKTCALAVPDLPSKFLLAVLRDTASVQGAMPLPMQNPHVLSAILAPLSMRELR